MFLFLQNDFHGILRKGITEFLLSSFFFWEQYPFYDVGFGFPPSWSYSITKVNYVSGQQKAVVYERNMPII